MIRFSFLLVVFLTVFIFANAQQTSVLDSVTLGNVIITAYGNNQKLMNVPGAISIVSPKDFNRNNNATILEAMNAKPGVRMEERSPGSYRLSIRGSSLRSPFGVRNVKVYYDGIPFTDPGGNTYFNQLGFYNFNSIEIIKGPAGSLYGAGTGGVLVIKTNPENFKPSISIAYTTGSYGLQNINGNVKVGNENMQNNINFQHLESKGYRDHTAMKRDVFSWDATLKSSEKSILQSHFFYSDLYYQTPGALNKSEYGLNAKLARPKAGAFPGADEAKAAFYAKTFLAGFTLAQKINNYWENSTSLYGAYSQNRNPNFRNYSRTSEPHFGGRTNFQYKKLLNENTLTINTGAEFQQSFNTQRIYQNEAGNPVNLQTDDEINNRQGFVFFQGNISLKSGWDFTIGGSINQYQIDFERLSSTPVESEKRQFNNELAPRLAVLKKVSKSISVYGNIARGFSAPTTAELLPSTNNFNKTLDAEIGVNYEAGMKGYFFHNKLYADVNAFFYRLKNALVQKRDASGGDYFDNAGKANQNGLESYFTYEIINLQNGFFNYGSVYVSHTWNNFHYKKYQVSDKDYSGNRIPGIASQTIAAGLDLNSNNGFYGSLNFFYSGRIALNDANKEYANPYDLLGMKAGYKMPLKKLFLINLFAGAQNMFDEKYSLGNDINGAGGRYYNVAPGRNFYAGMVFTFGKNK